MGKTAEPAADASAGADPTARGRDSGTAADHHTPAKVDLKFQLLFSALCHDAAETTAMRKHRAFTAVNLVLGSGAAVAIAGQYPVAAQVMALMVAVVGAAQLVWDFGKVGRDHALQRQRYYELLADLERGREEQDICASMITLYGTEPPVSFRMQKAAHNRAARSLYGDEFKRV